MKIPNSKRKKALFIVDIQPIFTGTDKKIINNVNKLIDSMEYDYYVSAVFQAPKNSIWDKQTDWNTAKDKNIVSLIGIPAKSSQANIFKTTKSVFKGDKSLIEKLKNKDIREIHIVGYDTNDCVLATAYESFDEGFFTYVIEECADSSEGKIIHEAGLKVLRHVNLTNNSCIEKIKFLNI